MTTTKFHQSIIVPKSTYFGATLTGHGRQHVSPSICGMDREIWVANRFQTQPFDNIYVTAIPQILMGHVEYMIEGDF